MTDEQLQELSRRLNEIVESIGAVKERLKAIEESQPYVPYIPYVPYVPPHDVPCDPPPWNAPIRFTWGTGTTSDPRAVHTTMAVASGDIINAASSGLSAARVAR